MIARSTISAYELSSSLCANCAGRLAGQAHHPTLATREGIRSDALTEKSHRKARVPTARIQGNLFCAQEPTRTGVGPRDGAGIGHTGKAARTSASEGFANQKLDTVMVFDSEKCRIDRHLKEPLRVLASISHDLQTPITRMRLRVEALMECTEQQKIINDLREMEHLVREGMSYARGTLDGAKIRVKIDPTAFLESLVFDYQDMGRPVTLCASTGGQVTTCSKTLRRVLGNLIDNAVKYAGTAEISAHRNAGGALCITVSDRGPGIPENELKAVLQPFYRPAVSRRGDIGGAGLGLAIVAQLLSSIEGNLMLSNRDGGGLAASITIP